MQGKVLRKLRERTQKQRNSDAMERVEELEDLSDWLCEQLQVQSILGIKSRVEALLR